MVRCKYCCSSQRVVAPSYSPNTASWVVKQTSASSQANFSSLLSEVKFLRCTGDSQVSAATTALKAVRAKMYFIVIVRDYVQCEIAIVMI